MDKDRAQIRAVIENWALWRDAGDWERFATVWHADGHMTATWFQGTAEEFIAASREGFDNGVRILHFLGGTTIDVTGPRAIAQTKMTITQRSEIHGAEVDVVCTGRFYDFFKYENQRWSIVRRQPIYESDRIHVIDPEARIDLNNAILAQYPTGYRHLAYVQLSAGFTVKKGLPGLYGSAVDTLYEEGHAWLEGSESAGAPL